MTDIKNLSPGYECIPRTEHRAADALINKGPCIVFDIVLAANGANADVEIHDGDSTNDEKKFHLEALSGTSISWNSKRGTLFRKGIYINVNATTTEVMITFVPWEFEGRQER